MIRRLFATIFLGWLAFPAMAAGIDKRAAILGALRAGCIKVLITDEATARAVLKGAARG